MPRQPEPELMDLPDEVAAYAHADFAEVNQAFVDRLLDLTGDFQGARCVDLGTGPADIPVRLIQARSDWTVTAIDASPPMLGFARHTVGQAGLSASIEIVQANALNTGLSSRSYDVVFSNSILHHLNDTMRFWQEVQRLGKEGAMVFLRDLYRPQDEATAVAIIEQYAGNESQLLQDEYRRSLMAAYTPEELRAQLAAVGLAHLTVETITDRHMDVYGRL
jgi:ubiquinone/menaquinone biosynthesis C-methylase UbiE